MPSQLRRSSQPSHSELMAAGAAGSMEVAAKQHGKELTQDGRKPVGCDGRLGRPINLASQNTTGLQNVLEKGREALGLAALHPIPFYSAAKRGPSVCVCARVFVCVWLELALCHSAVMGGCFGLRNSAEGLACFALASGIFVPCTCVNLSLFGMRAGDSCGCISQAPCKLVAPSSVPVHFPVRGKRPLFLPLPRPKLDVTLPVLQDLSLPGFHLVRPSVRPRKRNRRPTLVPAPSSNPTLVPMF